MYEWVKALHVISIIAWMAGLLYLPRLYVYHSKAPVGGELSDTLKVMERRLLRAIMNPAMIASWIFGLWSASLIDAWSDGWFHVKLLCVVLLTVSHMMMAAQRKKFERDENTHTHVYFRIFNEIPTLLMVVIVIFVIVKPF